MKRVLIYAPTAPGSGITQYILNCLRHADLNKFHFDILSFHNPRLEQWATEHDSVYYDLTVSLYKHPWKYKQFLTDVFSNSYDVVHFQLSAISTLRPFKYAKKCGIKKLILHSHNSFIDVPSALRRRVFSVVHRLLRGQAIQYFNTLCACSTVAAEWMFGPKNCSKAIIMNNAIDLERFSYSPQERKKIRESLNIQTPYVLGNIARFTIAKNQRFLLEMMAQLLKKRQDCTLLLIGAGDLLEDCKTYAKTLNIDRHVIFLPFQPDIYRYYSAMDVFVLPSLFEGLPLTLIEAQANGIKSVVSDAVSHDCDLTDSMLFVPLEKGAAEWADLLNELLQNVERQDDTEKIVKAGFSLQEQIKTVQNLYM